MNVNATLDGQAVTIVAMTIEHYRALVAYIDAQGGAGDLLVTEIPLEDISGGDITIATAASHN